MENLSSLRACAWNALALGRDEVVAVQERMRADHPGQALILSCQRIEAYGFDPCACDAPFAWHGRAALDHLAEVAAGLHSAVLGEAQILGQVRNGFAAARGDLKYAGDLAIASARELRRKTNFNSHAGHLLDRALKVARIPASGRILVLGTGQMGRLVAARAVAIGFEDVILAGRAPRAELPGPFVPLAKIRDLVAVDVVAGCLGSGATEIEMDSLPGARLVIDLGTPRNFGMPSTTPGGARLLTIAHLMADESRRPHAKRRRAALRRELSAIVDARVAAGAEDSDSVVGSLRARVEELRRGEVARMRRLHPNVAPETIDAMTRSLVNQLLHGPTERLRAMDPSRGRELVSLFE